MRFLAYSDIHFYPSWPEFNPLMPSGMTKWLEIQIGVWRQINDLANSLQVNAKLFGGDLVHKRSYIHTTANNSILDLYKKELKIPEYLISGNHDRYSPKFNAVQALDGIGSALVLDENTAPVITIQQSLICKGKKYVVSIQGSHPGGAVPKPVESFDPALPQFKILLAHGGLSGAETQSGFELEGGYTQEQLSAYNLVILGDIHKKQIIGNILIPGAPMQQSWGDSTLECGCWEIEIELDVHGNLQHQLKFHPIAAPRFIYVMQDNLEEVLKQEQDEVNYYDFKITEQLDPVAIKELRRRFPNSYIIPPVIVRPQERVVLDKLSTDDTILAQFFKHKIKSGSIDDFVRLGMDYLMKAPSKQTAGTHRRVEILWWEACNFMCFEHIRFDLDKTEPGVYLISGNTDEMTTLTNSIGKSAFAAEILSYVFFDELARSSTRSKDRLILDPEHLGGAKGLLTSAGIRIEGVTYIIQRFRKHKVLGTGCRILVQE